MPIDAMMLDPMLGTFRNMMTEIEEKGIESEHAAEMRTCLNRMEELGQEKSDFNDFNATMMNENLFGRFSDAYGKVLAEAAGGGKPQSADNYDDGALLKQNIDALRSSIQAIRDAKQAALDETKIKASSPAESNAIEIEAMCQNDTLIAGIENLIRLGEEPGMSFPRYLRIQIERGLDKVMEGNIVMRNGLEFTLGFTKAQGDKPYHVAMQEEMISVYDAMAATAAFNVPDSLEYQFAREVIERKWEPKQIKYDQIQKKWETMLDTLDTWISAHSKFAHYIDPWKMIQDPSARQRAIDKAQDCQPGELKVVEDIFNDYFGMTINDVWSHESFANAVKHHYIMYSMEYVRFLRDQVYPACQPFQKPSSELVQQWEQLYEQKRLWNPEGHLSVNSQVEHYDQLFGAGRYVEKFGPLPAPVESNAGRWRLGEF